MTRGLILSFAALLLLSGTAAAAPVGHVVAFTGEVSHLPGGSEVAAVPVALNTPLSLGDIVRTGEGGKARILLGDDTVLTLAPSTTLQVDETVGGDERVGRVKLLWGKVRAIVSRGFGEERGFEVQTETAVIGVKGTHFIVDSASSNNALGMPGPCTAGILVSGTGIRVSNPDGFTDVGRSWTGSVACSAPSGPLPCGPACQQGFQDAFFLPPGGLLDPTASLPGGPGGTPFTHTAYLSHQGVINQPPGFLVETPDPTTPPPVVPPVVPTIEEWLIRLGLITKGAIERDRGEPVVRNVPNPLTDYQDACP
jgi:hypothetical protein